MARIDIKNRELSTELCEIDQPFRGVEQELRHLEPDEMVGGAVVNGHR